MTFSVRREVSRWVGKAVQGFVTERLLKLPRPREELSGVSVHLLTSSRSACMGVLALRSLEAASGYRWPVWIHDDGTLTPKDQDLFRRGLEGCHLVLRRDIESHTLDRLAPWPSLQHMRRKFIPTMKLFDPWFHAPEANYVMLDADVLFLRKPEEIVTWARTQDAACYYNVDPVEVYGLPRSCIEQAFPFPLWPRVNAGLLLLRKEAISPDLSAEFLNRLSGQVEKPFFLDQVLYALNLSHYGKGGALPPAYHVHWGGPVPAEAISCHLVGDAKWTSFFVEALRRFPR